MVTRTTKQSPDTIDAVIIIALLRRKNNTVVETLLVEQFRPPVHSATVEFPAGLIDDGESAEEAALRELREETGYVGEQCTKAPAEIFRETCMSPGLCNETVQIVLVNVDLDKACNKNPRQQLDSGEFCKVKRVPLDAGMKKILDNGTNLPIFGLYMFALGLQMGANMSP